MMLTIKVCSGKDVRRLKVEAGDAGIFQAVAEAVQNSFGVPTFLATYLDDEGDTCVITGQEEMLEAIRLFKARGKHLKIHLDIPNVDSKHQEQTSNEPSAPEMAAPQCVFIADITLPDESVARGTVHKVWRIQNSGALPWPENCTIQGHGLEEAVPALAPEEKCDVALSISLPEKAGRFRQEFKLHAVPAFTGDNSLWINVHVEKPSALFVRDVKSSEKNLEPNQVITKTWAFKNDGKLSWPHGCKLVFKSGTLIPVEPCVGLPETKAGETALVSFDLRTPQAPGLHRAVFNLVMADETRFANHFEAWCSVDVSSPKVTKADFLRCLPEMLEDPEVRDTVESILRMPATHTGVCCDGCGVAPIRGIRYTCTVCPDFDLCEDCEAKDIHPASHVLLKMKRPEVKAKVKSVAIDTKEVKEAVKDVDAQFESDISIPDGSNQVAGSSVRKTWRIKNTGAIAWPEGCTLVWTKGKIKARGNAAVLASCLPDSSVDLSVDILIPFRAGRHKGHFRLITPTGEQFGDEYFIDVNVTREEFKLAKLARKAEKQAAKAAKQAAKTMKQAAKREARATKRAFKQLQKNATAAKVKAEFVEDVSLPDGSVIEAGASVCKCWRLRNTGTTSWPEGTELVFVRGDFAVEAKSVPVSCEPNATVDVAIDLIAPSEPGRAKGFFRLALPSGRKLPLKLWLETIVAVVSSDEDEDDSIAEQQVVSQVQDVVVTPVADITDEESSKVDGLRALGFDDEEMLLSLLRAAGGNDSMVVSWLTAQLP